MKHRIAIAAIVGLIGLSVLSPAEQLELMTLLEAREALIAGRKFYELFPDTGPRRRELYQKQLAFFRAGSEHDERLFMEWRPRRLVLGKGLLVRDLAA